MRGLFITGTDTGVGKTVTAAALLRHFRAAAPLRYWKPIQTGIEQDDDTATVRKLADCAPHEILDRGIRLRQPVSPHLAAQLAGRRIELAELVVDDDRPAYIVEGAGGVLVPINESQLMIDFIARLGLPVLVVARTALGTINHSLLTSQALRARGLAIAGVVLCGPPNHSNRSAIETYGAVPVVGDIEAPAGPVRFHPGLLEFLQ